MPSHHPNPLPLENVIVTVAVWIRCNRCHHIVRKRDHQTSAFVASVTVLAINVCIGIGSRSPIVTVKFANAGSVACQILIKGQRDHLPVGIVTDAPVIPSVAAFAVDVLPLTSTNLVNSHLVARSIIQITAAIFVTYTF